MFWRRMGPEEARVRLVLLREGVRQKVGALEARLAKRKAPLEKALKEYRGVLEHLRRLEAEGRYPEAVLRPALAREGWAAKSALRSSATCRTRKRSGSA